jgi:hypothetical protein
MGITNVLVEILIQFASYLTRPINETSNLKESVFGIGSIQYINLGTTLIFVSIKYPLMKELGIGWVPLLDG